MIDHGQTVVDAFRIGKKPKATWEILRDTLPEIHKEMTFNMFKGHITSFVRISDHLQRLKLEYGKLWATPNIDGWGVYLGKDNYYRAHRTIDGRAHSVHIGRVLDEDLARRKIAQKEREIGIRGDMIDAESESAEGPYFKLKISYLEATPPTRQQVKAAVRDLLRNFKDEP